MSRMTDYWGGSFVGASYLSSYDTDARIPTSYDTITFYGGNSGVVLDKVYGENAVLTSEEYTKRMSVDFTPEWKPVTYIYAEFNDSTNGGNIFGAGASSIEQWLIYRITDNGSWMEYLGSIPATMTQYIDYTALKGHTYRYYIFGQSQNMVSSPLTTQNIVADYWGWFLIDVENQTSYLFDFNFSGGELSQVTNYNEYNTNLQYNAYSRGATNYMEGEVTALVLDDVENSTQSVKVLDDLRDFVFSNKTKILKDNKGRIYKVFTSDYKDSLIKQGITGEPRYVSFAFKECGEV